jgi:hypothetical protein
MKARTRTGLASALLLFCAPGLAAAQARGTREDSTRIAEAVLRAATTGMPKVAVLVFLPDTTAKRKDGLYNSTSSVVRHAPAQALKETNVFPVCPGFDKGTRKYLGYAVSSDKMVITGNDASVSVALQCKYPQKGTTIWAPALVVTRYSLHKMGSSWAVTAAKITERK